MANDEGLWKDGVSLRNLKTEQDGQDGQDGQDKSDLFEVEPCGHSKASLS